ncbi:MAG: hypothetical protein IT320_25195 [Anaerolineae bacterium]|nr:hypothetical protein [Anaerolineae bacterium]
MTTIQLTAEYDPESNELEVLLPEGIDPKKLSFSRREPTAHAQTTLDPSPTWTEAELDAMFEKPERPMTAAEFAKFIEEEGGGWEDLGITDGAEWSNETRRKIEGRYKW